MIKLEAAYDSMPKSDERRASLSARTAQNTTMPLPALVLAPEDAEARDAKASGRGEAVPAAASMTFEQSHLRFTIRPVPPFRLDLTVWALRRRARNLVDRWDGTTYRRIVVVSGRATELSVRQVSPPIAPRLDVTVTPAPRSETANVELRRLLDRLLGLRIDLSPWYHTASRDPRLGRLADRFRGVKPPRFPTVFEALVNAFACQQLSLESGLTLLNRLAGACGTPFGPSQNAVFAFPAPKDLAQMTPEHLRAIGFSRQKARALLDLAGALTRQRLNLESLAQEDSDSIGQQLLQLRGVGRWTAEYALLRGFGRLQVFPGDDVGAQKRLAHWLGRSRPLDYAGVARAVAPWQPYAGFVYFHLLLHGLSLAGAFESAPQQAPMRPEPVVLVQ
jgi:DNA-3-methyladenine glycosylase II